MIKPDSWIKTMVAKYKMIEPFEESQVRNGNISFGLSSYGYDIRVANEFKIFDPSKIKDKNYVLDPKKIIEEYFDSIKTDDFAVLPPHSFALARTIEYFRIPRNVITICFGKSTYARCGVIVNITPFEPEWEGFVTLGISNTAPHPVKIYANEGIAQVLFLESNEICEISYADKKGKYQAQKQITHSKV